MKTESAGVAKHNFRKYYWKIRGYWKCSHQFSGLYDLTTDYDILNCKSLFVFRNPVSSETGEVLKASQSTKP